MYTSLTPNLEKLVQNKVESGLYNSASEVIREALRLLEARDRLRELQFEELKIEIQKGIDGGEATLMDMEKIKARGRLRLAAHKLKG
jgi:antitoxin ParD1/3/4